MTRRPLRISDHALVRFMERGLGWEVGEVRRLLRDILASDSGSKHRRTIRFDGLDYIIEGDMLVTVTKPAARKPRHQADYAPRAGRLK